MESMGVVSRRWMWVESMGVVVRSEVYRFPHITYNINPIYIRLASDVMSLLSAF